MVALSAAHGFAQISRGVPQAVVVHVECGTQSLAGAIHNAAKGRIPVFIFAGASPATLEGGARGSRNEFIHWMQDVFDQRGIVRGYMRYDNEIRVGASVKQIVHRALQFAYSDPKGPVYLDGGARGDGTADPAGEDRSIAEVAAHITRGLASRRRRDSCARSWRSANVHSSSLPTSGATMPAVSELVRLCAAHRRWRRSESVPNYCNFPSDDPLYQGSQWNEARQNIPRSLAADTILVIDSDVPWIPQINKPAAGARIIHIDIDPLKQQMPLWYIGARHIFRADAATALRQINERLDGIDAGCARAFASGRATTRSNMRERQ